MISTFSVNPQQGTRRFPIDEGVASSTPGCSTLVVGIARGVLIDGRVGGSDPLSKVLV